jgi:hypothetical protein
VIRTPQPFLSFANNPYSPRVRLMLLILDGHCRDKPYLWFSNAALAEEFGCSLSNLKEILREMEGLGLIHRVIDGQGKTSRVGIVLRRRVDPDLPAAETEAELAEAIARLTARRTPGRADPARGRKTAPTRGRKTAPTRGRKTAPELRSSSSREDASREDAGTAGASRRRPGQTPPTRPEAPPRIERPAPIPPEIHGPTQAIPPAKITGPTQAVPPAKVHEPTQATPLANVAGPTQAVHPAKITEPTRTTPTPEIHPTIQSTPTAGIPAAAAAPRPPAAATVRPDPPGPGPSGATGPPAPSEGLTAAQHDFVAGLAPDRRARFDRLAPGKRAQVLELVAIGAGRVALAELGQGMATVPLPPPDAGPFELIDALAGPWGGSLAPQCASALMKTLSDRGGTVSFRAIAQLCGEVAGGQRPPQSLAEPLEKTLREQARRGRDGDEPIANPAAYWTRGVANWDRDRRPGEPG